MEVMMEMIKMRALGERSAKMWAAPRRVLRGEEAHMY
jgi:hypothetical protein